MSKDPRELQPRMTAYESYLDLHPQSFVGVGLCLKHAVSSIQSVPFNVSQENACEQSTQECVSLLGRRTWTFM